MADKRSVSRERLIKRLLCVILYILASLGTCHAMFTLYTSVAYVGRMLQYTLPISTVCFIPLFLLIMFRRFENAVGNKMKWKIIFGTVVTTAVISLYSLVSCIVIGSSTNGIDGMLTPFFPIDMVVIDIIALLASIGGIVFAISKVSWLKEKQPSQPVKEYLNILIGLYLFIATFGFGAILRSFELIIDSDFDPNFPWVIANYFMIGLPTIGLIFRILYIDFIKSSRKRLGWIILMAAFALTVIGVYVWAFSGFAVNPYYYSQSTQSIFIGGFAFVNMPAEIFVILATCVISIGVSAVLFIVNGKK